MLFYGTPEQVNEARATAEQYKEDLLERGVFIVPLPLAEAQPGSSTPEATGTTAAEAAATYSPPAPSGDGSSSSEDDTRCRASNIVSPGSRDHGIKS